MWWICHLTFLIIITFSIAIFFVTIMFFGSPSSQMDAWSSIIPFTLLSETLLFISNPHICPPFHPPWRSNFSSGWNVEDGSLKLPDRPADRWSTRPVLAWMDLPLGYAPRGIFTHILPLIRKEFLNLCLVLIVKDHLAIHLLIGSEVSWINT